MTVPPEISTPVTEFLSRNRWTIIIILISIMVGYASVAFLGPNNQVEVAVEKVIEAETGLRVDLTP